MAASKTTSKILRILILDDSADDAEQASGVLRQAGYMLKTQRFETGIARWKRISITVSGI